MLNPMRGIMISLLSLVLFVAGCQENVYDMDIQGHRGCRGLMPENSIPAFLKALELGANTLEMDVVITADQQVVVSHEAWISHEYCLDSLGHEIAESDEKSYNIFRMRYADLTKYDCGSKVYSSFPKQEKLRVHKPLLREVIRESDGYASDSLTHLPRYNIELKRAEGGDGLFQPQLPVFVRLVLDVLKEADVEERTTLQAFDITTLQEIRRQAPDIEISLLLNADEDYTDKLADLGFYPAILSPDHVAVDDEMVRFADSRQMRVIPWTVNDEEEMLRLIELGVAGIITDYPDKLVRVAGD